MFINSLPLESCLRVWDVLFFEGSAVVLFRVALALVDVYQKVRYTCWGMQGGARGRKQNVRHGPSTRPELWRTGRSGVLFRWQYAC